ncbi:glycoside hydrolase family 53 protein [Winogradskyella aurantiaca]|uniref:glycoside hydrolase family 53 protein n=1 Tax=Winogradskyella aurantiaca TaxID=2219558 RepID=UPI000E1C4169|nr:glycosyl hydrolase 53 family protein [Winogradskyella aurantiaca]
MKRSSFFLLFASFSMLFSVVNCSSSNDPASDPDQGQNDPQIEFFFGADLSYVNEMEDCGAIYKNRSGNTEDAYQIFKSEGANLVRLRLWHSPSWTNYSNIEDVKKSMARAKAKGMAVLLDFHYSDTWADPEHQQIPAAWINHIDDRETLGDLMYQYTYSTLKELHTLDLDPAIVQIGNEINPMILQDGDLQWPINWNRNAYLLNKGLEAVDAINTENNTQIETMLHIAQPENGIWWFEQATANGVTNFDWIGLSYYPKWSDYTLDNVGPVLSDLMTTYNKRLMIVETAYPFTLSSWDNAGNILGSDSLIDGYDASIQGQLQYMLDLQNTIESAGGEGLIYWEPAWVSTSCSTQWGQGSHWENATMFDENTHAHDGISFYNLSFNN